MTKGHATRALQYRPRLGTQGGGRPNTCQSSASTCDSSLPSLSRQGPRSVSRPWPRWSATGCPKARGASICPIEKPRLRAAHVNTDAFVSADRLGQTPDTSATSPMLMTITLRQFGRAGRSVTRFGIWSALLLTLPARSSPRNYNRPRHHWKVKARVDEPSHGM